jgi:hypothetical protein
LPCIPRSSITASPWVFAHKPWPVIQIAPESGHRPRNAMFPNISRKAVVAFQLNQDRRKCNDHL